MHNFNPKYTHYTKLSQAQHNFILMLFLLLPKIRSTQILRILSLAFKITVDKSWINQILAREFGNRPRGRPPKSELENTRGEIYVQNGTSDITAQLGISLMLEMMDSLGLTTMFVNGLQGSDVTGLPRSDEALRRFINTLMQIILDQRIENFEEASRAEMLNLGMSVERARRLLKTTEDIDEFIPRLCDAFLDYWIEVLGLCDSGKRLTIFIDGHGSPYYTQASFVTGRMSVTGDISPGTHHVITTTDEGFILLLYPESVNTHLNHGLFSSCLRLKERLGDLLKLVVVDRECNGVDFNLKLKDELKVSVLTGLRDNQYESLADFEYHWIAQDILATGYWKDEQKRQNDPRTFLLYPQKDKLYVLTTTSDDVSFYKEAYSTQKARWKNNENVLKTLVNEFDLNVNAGNGTRPVANPQLVKLHAEHEKKHVTCDEHTEKLQNQLNNTTAPTKKQALTTAIKKWQQRKERCQAEYQQKRAKLPQYVHDRNFNPQGLMSMLKAGIYNTVLLLLGLIFGAGGPAGVGIEQIMDLLVNRGGRIVETAAECEFIFNPPKNAADRKLLKKFLKGISTLRRYNRQGRLIKARLASAEP